MRHTHRFSQHPTISLLHKQAGFSLIEVLIALIILSLGMLGAVGMQAVAMQANKETRNQSTATTFAYELADKMRSNYSIALTTTASVNPYLTATGTTLAGTATFVAPAENCFTTACTTTQTIANWDMADWTNRLRNALPDPRVVVCFDETPFDGSGKPRWACSNTGNMGVIKLAWTNSNTQGTIQFTASATTLPLVILPITAGRTN
jgi:type IV pilus assembly protein PilV